jgi:RNA polymerase sigma-70 factor (ECF subfamily)
LLRRVQQHDPEAWRAFADLYGPLIYGWVRRCGLSPDDAADATQETFLAVAQAIERFTSAGPGSFRGWLWTVTMNKVRDQIRRSPPQRKAVGGTTAHALLQQFPEPPDADTDSAARGELQALLHRALAQIEGDFSPANWTAFRRSVLEGADSAAVAEDLGISVNNLRQIRCRILRRLRDHLHDFLDR